MGLNKYLARIQILLIDWKYYRRIFIGRFVIDKNGNIDKRKKLKKF